MKPSEFTRRASHTQRVVDLFRAMPHQWIGWQMLANEGGQLAWRTRVADARKVFAKDGGSVVWNGDVQASSYMYRPQAALGPAAHEFREVTLLSL